MCSGKTIRSKVPGRSGLRKPRMGAATGSPFRLRDNHRDHTHTILTLSCDSTLPIDEITPVVPSGLLPHSSPTAGVGASFARTTDPESPRVLNTPPGLLLLPRITA